MDIPNGEYVMGVSGGPDVVTDGLVLSVDAANIKSFRGEPTTNLLPQPLSFSTGYTQESWTTGLVEDNAVMAPNGTMTATKITRVSGFFYKRNTTSPTFTIAPGDTITFSCWVKKLDSTNQTGRGINIWCYNGAGSGNRASATQSIESGEWVRQSVTYTALSGETDFSFGFSGAAASHLQGIIAIWRPQVEIKAYATPFVSGSRGTTVATGGGWVDLTGNSNHGELVNGPIYDSGNGGSIVFDGTNDYVTTGTTPSVLQGNPSFTLMGWFKCRANFAGKGMWGIGGNASLQGINNWNSSSTNAITIDLWGTATFSTGQTFPLNQWIFVAWQKVTGAFSRANITIWVNGTSYTGTQLSILRGGETSIPNINTQGLVLGTVNSTLATTYPTNVDIANIQVYNRILSPDEILQNFNATRSRFGV